MVGVLVVGLLVGMVGMTVASGSRTFLGAGAIFPIFMIGGVGMMMFGGRFGGQQQMSRPKLDAMRAQFMLMLDMLRETAQESADSMDHNYRWFHPAPARWPPRSAPGGCGSASPTARTSTSASSGSG